MNIKSLVQTPDVIFIASGCFAGFGLHLKENKTLSFETFGSLITYCFVGYIALVLLLIGTEFLVTVCFKNSLGTNYHPLGDFQKIFISSAAIVLTVSYLLLR